MILQLLTLLHLLLLTLCASVKPGAVTFTGFKVENQVPLFRVLKNEYHLLYFIDSKLIWDKGLNSSSIPWTETIVSNERLKSINSFVIARRKSYALRKNPLYLPNMVIGALFDGSTNQTIDPLVSEDFLSRSWVLVSVRSGPILHVPILTTPYLDLIRSNYLNQMDGWDKYLKINEDYSYAQNTKFTIKRALDTFIDQLDAFRLVKAFKKLNKYKGDYILLKMVLIGKYSSKRFRELLGDYDSLMQYD